MSTSPHSAYQAQATYPLEEISCTLYEYRHKETGACVLHVDADDEQNVFAILLQTTPKSSNGIAHILEHCVLCGSDKFPVKDPFFEMTRRSLNTFMNAFTGSDFTCYPAASQIKQDFQNLLSVYCDAVFHPKLTRESFDQEGWRFEFDKEKLVYKGIVFNEMKGQMSSPGYRMIQKLYEGLFPTLTYGINSGGDPKEIPALTYEEFKAFWEETYHPSRAQFFFYGNFPIEEQLAFLHDEVLKGLAPLPERPPIPREKRRKAPLSTSGSYPSNEVEAKSLLGLGWLTCHLLEQKHVLALSVLESVLAETDASPLRRALLESELCTSVSSSIDNDISEVPFILLLQGCNAEDATKIEELTLETLKKCIREGIPKKLIENALHQMELERLEITNDGLPYGLTLFFRSALLRMHSGDPSFGLKVHSLFEEIRADMRKNPRFFEDLLEQLLLENPHRVLCTLSPSETLEGKEQASELKILEAEQSKLSDEQKESICKQAARLAELQQEEVSNECLPKLPLSAIPKEERLYPLVTRETPEFTLHHYSTFTNGIVYSDLVYRLPEMRKELIPYVRLYATLMGQVGTKKRSWQELLSTLQEYTGGIHTALGVNTSAVEQTRCTPTLHIRGKALARNSKKLLELTAEIAGETHFTESDRIHEILRNRATNLRNQFNAHALKYAINLSGKNRTPGGALNYAWYGLHHYELASELSDSFSEKNAELIAALEEIDAAFAQAEKPSLLLTCDANSFENISGHLPSVRSGNRAPLTVPWEKNEQHSFHYPISAGVAFNVRSFKAPPYADPDAPYLALASQIFGNETLHERIREQGGAYGSGCAANAFTGCLTFYSYRDPNIRSTFSAYDEAVEKLLAKEVSEEALDEAKREMIQSLDQPLSPGSLGEVALGYLLDGRSDAMRQAYRDKILGATLDQVVEALINLMSSTQPLEITFAGHELLKKENIETPAYEPRRVQNVSTLS